NTDRTEDTADRPNQGPRLEGGIVIGGCLHQRRDRPAVLGLREHVFREPAVQAEAVLVQVCALAEDAGTARRAGATPLARLDADRVARVQRLHARADYLDQSGEFVAE